MSDYNFLTVKITFWGQLVCNHYSRTIRIIKEYLGIKKLDTVLDIGGGDGKIAKMIQEETKAKIIVVEPSPAMLKILRKRNLNFIKARAEKLPIASNFADFALFIQTLHHVPDLESAIQEVSRTLKNGGKLYIQELNESPSFFQKIAKKMESVYISQVYHYSFGEIQNMLHKYNFNVNFLSGERGMNFIAQKR